MATKSFRKRAIEVEAVQWTGENREALEASQAAIVTWSRGRIVGMFDISPYLRVPHHERADPGDWIVREDDDLSVYAPEDFEATYEPADQDRLTADRVTEGGGEAVAGGCQKPDACEWTWWPEHCQCRSKEGSRTDAPEPPEMVARLARDHAESAEGRVKALEERLKFAADHIRKLEGAPTQQPAVDLEHGRCREALEVAALGLFSLDERRSEEIAPDLAADEYAKRGFLDTGRNLMGEGFCHLTELGAAFIGETLTLLSDSKEKGTEG